MALSKFGVDTCQHTGMRQKHVAPTLEQDFNFFPFRRDEHGGFNSHELSVTAQFVSVA